MSEFEYVGTELDQFRRATHWKDYLRREMQPHLSGDVLEVGAGIGTMTRVLHRPEVQSWVCVEPDARLAGEIGRQIAEGTLPQSCSVRVGTLDAVDGRLFDAILYVDVLEHIEHDRAEVANAAAHLKPGGHLIVLSPAHQWLFTAFDSAIGHYRRYSKSEIAALTPDGTQLRRLAYLDSVGMLASASNRFVLRSAMPSSRQIRIWDSFMVPVSRLIDPLLQYRIGKSVLAVWQKNPQSHGRLRTS